MFVCEWNEMLIYNKKKILKVINYCMKTRYKGSRVTINYCMKTRYKGSRVTFNHCMKTRYKGSRVTINYCMRWGKREYQEKTTGLPQVTWQALTYDVTSSTSRHEVFIIETCVKSATLIVRLNDLLCTFRNPTLNTF
jgi:hypothetical protein